MQECSPGTCPPPDPPDPFPPGEFPSDQEPLFADPKAPVPTESLVPFPPGGGVDGGGRGGVGGRPLGAPPEHPEIPGGGGGDCPLNGPIGDVTIPHIL